MHYKSLGNTEIKVSELALGAMSFPNDEPVVRDIIDKAVAHGVNYIDTADLYAKGLNETLIGKVIHEKRKNLVIATKVGNRFSQDKDGWEWGPSKKYIMKAVEDSLRRLNTDYIDLYQLHGGTLEDPFDEIVEAFGLLKSQGKIRYYGISSIRPSVIRKYVASSEIVSVMTQYSLLDRRPEESVLPLLEEHNISVMVRGSLAKGLLVNKPPVAYLDYSDEDVKRLQDVIRAVVKADLTAISVALQFVLSHPAVTSAVVGIRTTEQLSDVLTYLKSIRLTEKERRAIASILPVNNYQEHQ